MLDFYRTMYSLGYLDKNDVHEAAQWGVISASDYKIITGEEFVTG